MYSANETYYRGTQSSFTTCYYLCQAPHSKGDRLSVERKKKYFAAEHLGYCGGTYQAPRGGKIDCIYKAVCGQCFFARYSWHAFLRLKPAYEYCKSQVTFEKILPFLRLLITFCLLKSFIAGPMCNRA